MKKVRIAQVGTGHDHAIQTYKSIQAHPEMFELVGVAEPNPERVKDLYPDAPHCTVDELLARDDLDAVAIETEESLSTEYAQLFADRDGQGEKSALPDGLYVSLQPDDPRGAGHGKERRAGRNLLG